MYQFPASELDSAQSLLRLMGSLWSDTYLGNFLIESMAYARGRVEQQAQDDFDTLAAGVSRFSIPFLRIDDWYALVLKESDRNQATADLSQYDDGATAYDDGSAYDTPRSTTYSVWALPAGLTEVPVVHDAITTASVSWFRGIDYKLQGGAIWFTNNPFETPGFAIQEIFQATQVVDRTVTVWLYRSRWNHDDIYKRFGYVLDQHIPSTRSGKNFLNAIMDAVVQGTTARAFGEALAALADIPLAIAADTVTQVVSDVRNTYVVTAGNVYRFKPASQILVSVGDAIVPGQALSNGLQIFEFNRGQLSSDLRALSVGRGYLGAAYFQDLTFENKTVPLVVEENVDGFTKISFEIGGVPDDVLAFWETVHAFGVAKGQTLAMLMDQRPIGNQDTQPTAAALPTTINPLGFLVQNVFRSNLFAATIRPDLFGDDALGLDFGRALRRITPPGTSFMLLTELEISGDRVTMDGPGTPERAGVSENVDSYQGASYSEVITPALIREQVTGYYVGGRCE